MINDYHWELNTFFIAVVNLTRTHTFIKWLQELDNEGYAFYDIPLFTD